MFADTAMKHNGFVDSLSLRLAPFIGRPWPLKSLTRAGGSVFNTTVDPMGSFAPRELWGLILPYLQRNRDRLISASQPSL